MDRLLLDEALPKHIPPVLFTKLNPLEISLVASKLPTSNAAQLFVKRVRHIAEAKLSKSKL